MTRHRWAALLCATALVCMLFSGCSGSKTAGRNFRFPLDAEPKQLDPQATADTASLTVMTALFEGLTRLDDNGKAIAGAAEWDVSADGLTYTFHLRDSKWSNGEAVTAADFVFAMQRTVDPATKSPLSEKLDGIAGAKDIRTGNAAPETLGVTAPNEHTVEIRLTAPDEELPEKLAGAPFYPCNRVFFEQCGGRYGLETAYTLTNGAFSLKSWRHNEYLILSKSEHYRETDNVIPAAVRYVIGQPKDAVASLKAGSLDAALVPAPQSELTTVTLLDTITYLWMNNSQRALSSATVRQALRDAVEWETLWAAQGNRTPATGYAAADARINGEYYRTTENALTWTTEADARQRLSKGLSAMSLDTFPAMTLLCTEQEQETAQYIAQSWQKNLGVYVTIETVNTATLSTRVQVGNYTLAIAPATASDSDAAAAFAMMNGDAASGNWARHMNTAVAQAVSEAETREQLETAEQQLADSCPAVPLWFEPRYYGLAENVSGVTVRPFGGGKFGAALDFRSARKKD